MKVVFIIGNGAVGKMTVGQQLMEITDLRLFHNHMMIEPVIDVMGQYRPDITIKLRDIIFEEFAISDNYGMIFTYMWAFDLQSDWDYIEHVKNIFLKNNNEIQFYYIELVAPQTVRLERNATENRLRHKASKRDIEASNQRVLYDDNNHRIESFDGEIPFDNYIKIDNSKLCAEDTAKIIRDKFDL